MWRQRQLLAPAPLRWIPVLESRGRSPSVTNVRQPSYQHFRIYSLTAFATGFAEPARDAGFLEGGLADDAGLLEALEAGLAALGGLLAAALDAGFAAAAFEGGLESAFA